MEVGKINYPFCSIFVPSFSFLSLGVTYPLFCFWMTFFVLFIETDFLFPLLADLIAMDIRIPIAPPKLILIQGISELVLVTILLEITELSNSEIKESEYHSARISTGFPVGQDSIEIVLDISEFV